MTQDIFKRGDYADREHSPHKPCHLTKLCPFTINLRTLLPSIVYIQGLDADPEYKVTLKKLKQDGQAKLTLEERKRRARALERVDAPNFDHFVRSKCGGELFNRKPTEIFQLNIGLYCNQACNHCHVESSPKRTAEQMTLETARRCVDLLLSSETITTLDITGGAPELNPVFRFLVEEVRRERPDLEIIDRCNLTVLSEPEQEDLSEFLASHRVAVVASLPCYGEKNVNMQRGRGVFEKSIFGCTKLNAHGYGIDPALPFHLVYNPIGAFLPPEQGALEEQYKEELHREFGIRFNSLFTITNMPIKRFADFLHKRGELASYMELLVNSFNQGAVDGLMCRNTVSVGWDGRLFDCDFNQQLDIGLACPPPSSPTAPSYQHKSVFDVGSLQELEAEPIAVDSHCYGCTAGFGSSCQGATA
mmetsp:Transcript_12398/g.18104  ORF Transcript_12398/g.18104 Transcript_12398/m.18104 type:complete len:418 (+) Transcript_12398:264-1517(+)